MTRKKKVKKKKRRRSPALNQINVTGITATPNQEAQYEEDSADKLINLIDTNIDCLQAARWLHKRHVSLGVISIEPERRDRKELPTLWGLHPGRVRWNKIQSVWFKLDNGLHIHLDMDASTIKYEFPKYMLGMVNRIRPELSNP